MNVTAIIAEYNPFHNGHAYQIRKASEETNSDFTVVIMSGDFVQRGEPAIIDKYTRAKMALHSGADLILELPVFFSCASAPYFASGAVSILNKLSVVNTLCFGCECGTADDFLSSATILNQEPPAYKSVLNRYLKAGLTFPAARERAFSDVTDTDGFLLKTPNNILGIEYAKAVLRESADMTLLPLTRIGESYHSLSYSTFASATALRKAISENNKALLTHALPEEAVRELFQYLSKKGPVFADDLSSILGYLLLKTDDPENFSHIFDIGKDLANRIFQRREQFQSFSSYAADLKTKNETFLHMNRALLHIILGLSESSLNPVPLYTRILGMKKTAAPLLHEIKKSSSIPLLAKLGNADDVITNFYADEPDKCKAALTQLSQTTFASNLYQTILREKYQIAFAHEYTRQFPIL